MRILITGMTPTQCGRPGRFQWLVVPALFAQALRRAGHQVEHRACTPNEDLTPYDVILVGLVPPGSIAARHVYVTMDVIGRARTSGAALLFYVDDWQFDKIMSGCRNKHKQPHGLYTTIKGRTHRDWAETPEGRAQVARSMEALATRQWPTTLSVAFPWGDHTKLDKLPARETVYVDPSPLCWTPLSAMIVDKTVDPGRERQWILASLSDHRPWLAEQRLSWPVKLIGPKQTGAEHTLKEHEIVRLVNNSAGTLCPPYHHAGSGWWRPRYQYTAVAGAVALPAADDAIYLGEPYQVSAAEIEALNDQGLRDLSVAQFSALYERTWRVEQLVEVLDKTLTANLLGPVKEQKLPANNKPWVDVREQGRGLREYLHDNAGLVELTKHELAAEYPEETTEEVEAAFDAGEKGVTTPPAQPIRREGLERETREFDRTYLRENKHGKRVHRDYAAHFFRWGWATRLIKPEDRVLDVGCGPDLALANVLTMGGRYIPQQYVGVDLNKLSGGPGWAELLGETNVLETFPRHPETFSMVVAFEVIEHMTETDGHRLLKTAYESLDVGGRLLLSTPCFNGKAARNHIHEWTNDELATAMWAAGFRIDERYGTFASYPDIKRVATPEHLAVLEQLRRFYSDEVAACFLAPMYPNESRNNVWLCIKEGTENE